jgi:hypothetical protein
MKGMIARKMQIMTKQSLASCAYESISCAVIPSANQLLVRTTRYDDKRKREKRKRESSHS